MLVYTKRGDSSAATSLGAHLHLFSTVQCTCKVETALLWCTRLTIYIAEPCYMYMNHPQNINGAMVAKTISQ